MFLQKFLNDVIILNFNDTIVNSSEVIIDIINNRYNINKKYKDLKDKNFRSIYKNITKDELKEIKKSKEYLEKLKFDKSFIDVYNKFSQDFTFIIDSNSLNEKEKEYVEENIPLLIYNAKEIPIRENYITIDENTKNLINSLSRIRILLSNDKPWSKIEYNEELYEMHTWKDIDDLLTYIQNKGW